MDLSTTKSKLLSNTAVQFVGKLISMGVTLLTTVVITRLYGREAYGWFNLIQAWPAFVYIIVDFGLNAVASREITKKWELSTKYFNTVLGLRVAMSLLFMVGLAILLAFFNYDPALKGAIRLNLFLILTQALYATTNIIFQVKLRYDLSTIGYVLGYVAILIGVIALSAFKVDVKWLGFCYVVGGFITFFVNAHYISKLGVKLTPSAFDFNLAKTLFYQSLPLGLMFVFSQVNFKSDVLLISVLKLPNNFSLTNVESVGIYGLAYKIFEVLLVVPTFFMNSAYPVLISHKLESGVRLKSTFIKVLKGLFVSGIAVAGLVVVLSPLIIKLLGGPGFEQSVLVLQILAGGVFLYFLTQPFAWLLVTLERQKYLPAIYLISAIFNVSANLYFIPKFSYLGSAFVTHASELIILFLLIFYTRKAWKETYAKV